MLNPETIELSEKYFNKAFGALIRIPKYIELNDFTIAVNRAYYAAFYSLKAIELLDNYDSKKHSGVIAYFRKQYVKTGIFDSHFSTIIGQLQDAREVGDYNIVAEFSEKEAQMFYEMAKEFVIESKKQFDKMINE